MTTEQWKLVFYLCFTAINSVVAQQQIDFREQTNLRIEHRFSQDFSVAFMGAAILTSNFHHSGFVYGDGGLGYKINAHLGLNANYRMLFRRAQNGSYDKRHVLYVDVDYSKGLPGSWILTGTLRLQGQYFNHLFGEGGYRRPNFYARTRLGLRYKINYYWQPFTESELFTPLFSVTKKLPDQLRYSIGFTYTFNRYLRLEAYEQMQKSLNASPGNIFFLTAINFGIRL